jgi:hypothetical protein
MVPVEKNEPMQKLKKGTSAKDKRDETAQVVADVLKFTPDIVRKVLRGERNNPLIVQLCRYYKKGKEKLIKEMRQIAKDNRR